MPYQVVYPFPSLCDKSKSLVGLVTGPMSSKGSALLHRTINVPTPVADTTPLIDFSDPPGMLSHGQIDFEPYAIIHSLWRAKFLAIVQSL